MQNATGQPRRTSVRKRLGGVLGAAALSCAAIVTSFIVSWVSCKEGDDGCGIGLLVAAAAVVPAFLLGGAALILLSERTSSPILTNVITALAVFFALIPLEMVFLRQIWAVFAFSGLFAVFVAMVLSEPGVAALEKEVRVQTPSAPSAPEADPAHVCAPAVVEKRVDVIGEASSLPSSVSSSLQVQSGSSVVPKKHRATARRRVRGRDISRESPAFRRRPTLRREGAARVRRAWRAAAEKTSPAEPAAAEGPVTEPRPADDNSELIERLESSVGALERLVAGAREPEPAAEADASPIEERLQELSNRVQLLVEGAETAGKERGPESGSDRFVAPGSDEELRLICRQVAALLSGMNGDLSSNDLQLQLLAISGLRRRLADLSRRLEDGPAD